MKIRHTLSIYLIITISISAVWGARGRVRIANNGAWDYNAGQYDTTTDGYTVVTDQGTLLRGTTFWCLTSHNWNVYYAQDFSSWEKITQYKLNAVRLALNNMDPDALGYPVYFSEQQWLEQIDTWVDWGDSLGIYVVLEHHEAGGHTQDTLKNFWSSIAPRYSDRTHVIYEIANEPVAWRPEDYTDQDIADIQELHDLIRAHAPETHIVLMSYAIAGAGMDVTVEKLKNIDWTRCSVGFHGYWEPTSTHITTLKKKYPAFNTEFMIEDNFAGSQNRMDGYKWHVELMEKLKISWLSWDTNHKAAAEAHAMIPTMDHIQSQGLMWTPDNYTNNIRFGPGNGAIRPEQVSAEARAYDLTGRGIDLQQKGLNGIIFIQKGNRIIKLLNIFK